MSSEKFRQKIEERRQQEQKQKVTQSALPSFADAIPEDERQASEQDKEIDRFIKSIDILEAYRRWCGKSAIVKRPNQTEGIMVSCPVPEHPDKNPSAWINTDKQTWFCAGCQQGGDAYDIAAYHFGYPVPGYKEGANFHRLREEMAQDYGLIINKMPGGAIEVIEPEEESEEPEPVGKVATPEPTDDPEESDEDSHLAPVVNLYDDDDEDDTESYNFPSLDWRSIIPEDTFLHHYMRATTIDDLPEEYHFWNGLIALGFALGRDVTLFDRVPVYGNLFVCTIGRSGSGKSRARSYLSNLLRLALPHDWNDPNSKGVRIVNTPASAETLIFNFQKPVSDPADPKKILYNAPVRGLIDFNELSSLMGRANRAGNVLKPALMQFYDMENTISTSSMTTGLKEASEPFASALTTTQPKSLRNLIETSDDASGFLNRWVFAIGPEKKRIAIGGATVDVTPAVMPLKAVAAWAATFGNEPMNWSPAAASLFSEFFHNTLEPDKHNKDNDLLIRTDLLTKKLCLLLTANKGEKIVSDVTVKEVMGMYPYLLAGYGVPEGQIGATLQNDIAEAVLTTSRKYAEKHNQGITLNLLAKHLKRRNYPMKLLIETVDYLTKLGYLAPEASRKGTVGRPTTRYKYVD